MNLFKDKVARDQIAMLRDSVVDLRGNWQVHRTETVKYPFGTLTYIRGEGISAQTIVDRLNKVESLLEQLTKTSGATAKPPKTFLKKKLDYDAELKKVDVELADVRRRVVEHQKKKAKK